MKSQRTPSGAAHSRSRKKKKRDRGSLFVETRIAERKRKVKKAFGGRRKIGLLSAQEVNLADGKSIQKAKILTVVENAANVHYVRRNILTKGAVIKTDKGLARVTSRPGQDGVVNAVLLKERSKGG
jgi:small subunit ribosomal protein S8e